MTIRTISVNKGVVHGVAAYSRVISGEVEPDKPCVSKKDE